MNSEINLFETQVKANHANRYYTLLYITFFFTNFQKTLPTFPSATQSQLKLLNMGNHPVSVVLNGQNLELPAAQVYLSSC